MTGVGVDLSGTFHDWTTMDMDTSNTVNGKPIYYLKNQTSGTVPSGGGQVFLANCTNVTVQDYNLNDCTEEITLGYSSYCTVRNNTVSSNSWGYGVYLNRANHKHNSLFKQSRVDII